MLKIDETQWKGINATILNAWRNTERRGTALLFAAPVFGLPFLAAAYWGIPQTQVPAYIVAVVLTGAMVYLLNGMKRLKKRDVLWIRAILQKKQETRVSHTNDPDSVSHHLTLKAAEALTLSRTGTLSPKALPIDEIYSTTEAVFNHLTVGDEIWAAVMPHDNAVYFIVDETGTLHPL